MAKCCVTGVAMTKLELKKKLFGHYPEHVLVRFKAWHMVNPEIYEQFEHLALHMIVSGRKKYSAEIIINKIRWEHDIKTDGDVFKINNDFKAIMARLFIYNNPNYDGFFELRINPNAKYVGSTEQHERQNNAE